MKLKMKAEKKHSVVYEATEDNGAVTSVYVMKLWLVENKGKTPGGWAPSLNLELTVEREGN